MEGSDKLEVGRYLGSKQSGSDTLEVDSDTLVSVGDTLEAIPGRDTSEVSGRDILAVGSDTLEVCGRDTLEVSGRDTLEVSGFLSGPF